MPTQLFRKHQADSVNSFLIGPVRVMTEEIIGPRNSQHGTCNTQRVTRNVSTFYSGSTGTVVTGTGEFLNTLSVTLPNR